MAAYMRAPLGYQQITDLDPAVGLTAPANATRCLLQAEAQGVRWRDDGTVPTTSVGMRLFADTAPILYEGDLSAIRFFDDTAGAILNITYYA